MNNAELMFKEACSVVPGLELSCDRFIDIGFNQMLIILKDARCFLYDSFYKSMTLIRSNYISPMFENEESERDFKLRFTAICNSRGLDPLDVLTGVGFPRSSAYRLLSGKGFLRLDTAIQLADRLGCNVTDFTIRIPR